MYLDTHLSHWCVHHVACDISPTPKVGLSTVGWKVAGMWVRCRVTYLPLRCCTLTRVNTPAPGWRRNAARTVVAAWCQPQTILSPKGWTYFEMYQGPNDCLIPMPAAHSAFSHTSLINRYWNPHSLQIVEMFLGFDNLRNHLWGFFFPKPHLWKSVRPKLKKLGKASP